MRFQFTESDLRRFWRFVDKSGDCWVWKSSRDPKGYGRFGFHGRTILPHRASYELLVGPIPDDLCVLHHCDNPPCIRPDHLFLGTRADNLEDMRRKGRGAVGDKNGARQHPERLPRGEQVKCSKLTEEKVRRIRARYDRGGITKTALAAEYGVSVPTMSRIVRRHIWRHVSP